MGLELAAETAMNARNAEHNRRLIKLGGDCVDGVAIKLAAAGFDDPLRDQCAG